MVELSSCEMELKALVADTGTVHSVVAGFEIKVLDGELFPWENVLEFILSLPHQVWIMRFEGSLVIKTKPPGF